MMHYMHRVPPRTKWAFNVGGARILMLQSPVPASSGTWDETLYNMLVGAGAAVTTVVGSEANVAANVANKDLVILSGTALTSTYGATAQASTLPWVINRNQVYPVSNAGFSSSFGVNTATAVDTLNPNHPMQTGETDASVDVYTSGSTMRQASGVLRPGLLSLAKHITLNGSVVFCLEKGSEIDATVNGGICAGRRVGIGLEGSLMTDRAMQYWVDAINWCLGT